MSEEINSPERQALIDTRSKRSYHAIAPRKSSTVQDDKPKNNIQKIPKKEANTATISLISLSIVFILVVGYRCIKSRKN